MTMSFPTNIERVSITKLETARHSCGRRERASSAVGPSRARDSRRKKLYQYFKALSNEIALIHYSSL